ncbi:unnamed protein product [Protopolystoma xenopodis]|uniref:Uncharacterized protein n=1 Tax=Protopolystoma xenopodis TaxID=117903 RepID=A0A3S5AR14_9PLAT|nr:unnamed protein product [Protopolystoma xenopodis]
MLSRFVCLSSSRRHHILHKLSQLLSSDPPVDLFVSTSVSGCQAGVAMVIGRSGRVGPANRLRQTWPQSRIDETRLAQLCLVA